MDKVSREELFSAIMSSTILTRYKGVDPELAILLENRNHIPDELFGEATW